jgi:hypothetical protein
MRLNSVGVRRVIIIVIGVGLGFLYQIGSDSTDYAGIKRQLNAAMASIPKKENWADLKPGSDAERNYSFDLVYKRDPTPEEARDDATAIATLGMRTLQKAGFNLVLTANPITVYTERNTGSAASPAMKGFGHATYDAGHDEIAWQGPSTQ